MDRRYKIKFCPYFNFDVENNRASFDCDIKVSGTCYASSTQKVSGLLV